MSATLHEVERDALRLPAKEREQLVDSLVSSLAGEPLSDVDIAWIQEAERRREQWLAGREDGVPALEAFDRIREAFGWRR